MDAFLAGGEHDCTGLPRRAALSQALAALLPVPLRPCPDADHAEAPPRQQLTLRPGAEILHPGTAMQPVGSSGPAAS